MNKVGSKNDHDDFVNSYLNADFNVKQKNARNYQDQYNLQSRNTNLGSEKGLSLPDINNKSGILGSEYS